MTARMQIHQMFFNGWVMTLVDLICAEKSSGFGVLSNVDAIYVRIDKLNFKKDLTQTLNQIQIKSNNGQSNPNQIKSFSF